MYIEIEAPSRDERTRALYVGPFANVAAARAAIDQSPGVAFEPVRAVTGNGVMLMARAITATRPRRIPTVPTMPDDREEFALLHYQYRQVSLSGPALAEERGACTTLPRK